MKIKEYARIADVVAMLSLAIRYSFFYYFEISS